MDNENALASQETKLGSIKIADEVVSIIAGLAAIEIEGIAGMSGGVVGGIAEMLGRKNFIRHRISSARIQKSDRAIDSSFGFNHQTKFKVDD